MLTWIWVLIPITAILMGGFQQWLRFRRETASLESSTGALNDTVKELTSRVRELERERAGLTRRVQNLEAIVTSEAWETLGQDPELAAARAQPLLPDPPEPDDSERAATLARRLRTL